MKVVFFKLGLVAGFTNVKKHHKGRKHEAATKLLTAQTLHDVEDILRIRNFERWLLTPIHVTLTCAQKILLNVLDIWTCLIHHLIGLAKIVFVRTLKSICSQSSKHKGVWLFVHTQNTVVENFQCGN